MSSKKYITLLAKYFLQSSTQVFEIIFSLERTKKDIGNDSFIFFTHLRQ